MQDNYDSKGPSEDDTSQSRRQSRLNRYAMSSVEEDEGQTEQATKMAWRSSNLYRQIKRFSKIPLTGHRSSPEVGTPNDNVPISPKENAPATDRVPMGPKENAPATDQVATSPKENAPADEESITLSSNNTSLQKDTSNEAERSEATMSAQSLSIMQGW